MPDPVFAEDFTSAALDPDRWVAHYLPQWTTPERSAARFDVGPDGLTLRIDVDQPAWSPSDGDLRVSNLQTGTFSGPAGSPYGTHRHRADLRVVTPQPTRRLFLPTGGRVEATLRGASDPSVMLAFWLVGFEEVPEDSGEICVAELFGRGAGPGSEVNVGVKAHHDPRLVDDMVTLRLDLDTTEWHTYAAEWGGELTDVRFLVDGTEVHRVEQRLPYPLQLMVDLFEFPRPGPREPADYPKVGYVRSVRAFPPPDALAGRLRTALTEALRARDRAAASVLRSVLAAVDNAGAVPLAPAPGPTVVTSPYVAGAAAGLGAAEAGRRTVTDSEVRGLVQAEAAELTEAAQRLEDAGRSEDADRVRHQAAVLETLLDARPPGPSQARSGR